LEVSIGLLLRKQRKAHQHIHGNQKTYNMKFISFTAAAALAFAIAQVDAVPSNHRGQHRADGGRGQVHHGPMPDDVDSTDNIDPADYVDSEDPIIRHLARRAADPEPKKKPTNLIMDDPASHWWENQGGKNQMPENGDVLVGNPNLPPIGNLKNDQGNFGRGLKARSEGGHEGGAGDHYGGEGGHGMGGGQGGKDGKKGGWAKHPEGGAPQGSGKPEQ
jgi:hypothetical protein